MWPLALLALSPAVQAPPASAGNGRNHIPTDVLVRGDWRYDPKTLQIILSEKARKEMIVKGPAERVKFEKGKGFLQDMFARMHLRFELNHHFRLTGDRDYVVAEGTWSTKGASILTTPDKKRLHMMDLTLAPSGLQIFGVQRNPGIGETRITLVRR
jgi:hypothetical protein